MSAAVDKAVNCQAGRKESVTFGPQGAAFRLCNTLEQAMSQKCHIASLGPILYECSAQN
jgi:hypothetical protein